MTAVTLVVECEGCGGLHEMPRDEVALWICLRDVPRSFFTFTCPTLQRPITTHACQHILLMFAGLRMPFRTFSVPVEVLEREAAASDAPPLTEDDLITFGQLLAEIDTTKGS